MKKIIRTALVAMVVTAIGTPAFAQQAATAAASSASAPADPQSSSTALTPVMSTSSGSAKTLKWTGAGLFVAGMSVGMMAFLNNKNGIYPEFGEATATNKPLGAAGISLAFAGGALMAISHHISKHAPEMQISRNGVAVSKTITW